MSLWIWEGDLIIDFRAAKGDSTTGRGGAACRIVSIDNIAPPG